MGDGLRLKDILGMPLIPPGRVTRAAIRVRGRMQGAHRSMAPPAVRVLEGLFGIFDNRVLGLLVELDLPELLKRRRSAYEIAELTATDPDRLERVLRYAAGRGFLDVDRDGLFRNNEVTDVLRRNHPNSWRGWIEFASSDWFWDSWRHLRAAVDTDDGSGIEAATGARFFDYVTKVRPAAGDAFDSAMTAGATMQALALSHALDWTDVRSVCDIGGGAGAALNVLLQQNPALQGVLFDLPSVVAKAKDVTGRLRVEGGDFFAEVPAGCERYLLLAVIHDWNDDEAVTILRNVASAMGPSGRAFVIENELPPRPRGEFVEASDVLMLVLGSGRERTRAQFEALFARSGLALDRAHVLPTGFNAFELSTRG